MTCGTRCCIGTRNTCGLCRTVQGPQGYIGPQGATGATGPPAPTLGYGCFTSSQTQQVANVDEPTLISYDTTQIASGVSYSGNNEIIVSSNGIYKIGASPEFDYTSGNKTKPVVFWFRKNYQDIPDSASVQVVSDKDSELYTYVEFIVDLQANDSIQCFFASSELTMQIASFSANSFGYTHPAIPSIILTVQQIV